MKASSFHHNLKPKIYHLPMMRNLSLSCSCSAKFIRTCASQESNQLMIDFGCSLRFSCILGCFVIDLLQNLSLLNGVILPWSTGLWTHLWCCRVRCLVCLLSMMGCRWQIQSSWKVMMALSFEVCDSDCHLLGFGFCFVWWVREIRGYVAKLAS